MTSDLVGPATVKKVAEGLNRIKTPVQLTGWIVAAGIVFLALLSDPLDVTALICGGLIAVSILVFGVLLNQLQQITKSQRAWLIIATYGLFAVIITVFFALAIWQLGDTRAIAGQLRSDLMALRTQAVQRRDLLTSEIEKLRKNQKRINQERTLADAEAVASSIETETRSLERTHASLRRIEGLLDDLNKPDSHLLAILRDSKELSLDLANDGSTSKLEDGLRTAIGATISMRVKLAWLKLIDGQVDLARQHYKLALLDDPAHEQALIGLAELESEYGSHEDAATYWERLIEVYRSADPPRSGHLAYAQANRGTIGRLVSDFSAAEKYFDDVERTLTASFSNRDFYAALAANDAAFYYFVVGRFQKAEKMLASAKGFYANDQDAYGYSDILSNFGAFQIYKEDLKEAEILLRQALSVMESSACEGSYGHGIVLLNLGRALHLAGQFNEGLERLEVARRIFERQHTSTGYALQRVNFELALAALYVSKPPHDLSKSNAAIDQLEATTGRCHYRFIESCVWLSEGYRGVGLYEEAQQVMNRVSVSTCRIPQFLADSYAAEALLVEVLLSTNRSDSVRGRIDNLRRAFDRYREPFPWVERKLGVASAILDARDDSHTSAISQYCKCADSAAGGSVFTKAFLETIKKTYFTSASC